MSKPEFPPAYASDSKFEKVKGVSLNAKQTIPNVDQWQKSQQIEIDFNLDQVEKQNSLNLRKFVSQILLVMILQIYLLAR